VRRLAFPSDTDAQGRFELCVDPGTTRLVVTADGYATLTAGMEVYGPLLHDFELRPEATVAGRVIRKDDGQPIGGALVSLSAFDSYAKAYTTTKDDGTFSVAGVTPGNNSLVVRADRLSMIQPLHVEARVGTAGEPVVCELEPTYSVAGRVVAKDGGKGVSGVVVGLSGRNHFGAMTQTDGSFSIDGIAPGDYSALAGRLVEPSKEKIHVVTSDIHDIVLEIQTGASIKGRVLRAGKVVEGARVNAGYDGGYASRSTTTDATGHYNLPDLESGSLRVYAESQRTGAFTNGPKIDLAKEEQRTNVDLDLDLDASVSGIVVDQNDVAVAGMTVRFSLLHGQDSGTATTADDGAFAARALSGGGDYLYEVRSANGTVLRYADEKRTPSVAVRDGATHVTGLRIKVVKQELVIGGRVVDATGQPAADVVVLATAKDGTGAQTTVTAAAGGYEVKGLTPGAYTMSTYAATGDDHAGRIVDAGARDVVIHLLAPTGIDGTFDPLAGTPVIAALSPGGESYGATVIGSTFRIRDLPAGSYEVQASRGHDIEVAQVTLVARKISIVALHRQTYGILTVTLLDARRAPVVHADCRLDPIETFARFAIEGTTTDATTDATGAARFDHAPAGPAWFRCFNDSAMLITTVDIVANQTTHRDFTAEPRPQHTPGTIGVTFETQFSNVIVKAVVAGGAGDRAGIAVGDIVTAIDGSSVHARYEADVEGGPAGTTVRFSIDRGDKQLTLEITLDPIPN